MSSVTTAAIDRRVQVIDDPKNDRGAIQRVSDLRALPFVVLLGEPGIGKSMVLKGEAAREGVPVLTVREFVTGTRANTDATLYLDALDEYRADGGKSDKIYSLSHAMMEVKAARWRLSCRCEDWRKGTDIAQIKKAATSSPIVVAQLLPLDHVEAAAILTALGQENPEAFLAKAISLGAAGFIESPLSLTLLHKAVAGGGTWPSMRYDLFDSAVRRLAFERNEEYKFSDRHNPNDILNGAGEACLLLLTSGARLFWRSNGEPPAGGDTREYVFAHDLGLDQSLLSDMLDTVLFRGEGEGFEPTHRTIAEFLAGKALAKAVMGTGGREALPLSRAVALITGVDGLPPTELRGLYAWLAAHLTKLGDDAGALRLIEADAFTVLAYGDAAVFDTTARRTIFANLDQNDPYFRTSEVGVTAVGGLAGQDLADDFAAVLTGPSDGTHRLLIVFDALTSGAPVPSLRPLLRVVVLDAARPEWQRRRAVESYVNGTNDPVGTRRELFDALSSEAISTAREALRAQLAAGLPRGVLQVADIKSVLADYKRSPEDNMMGRLYGLQRRLETEPITELFDEPTGNWLPKTPDRRHSVEIEHVLDYALAGAIKRTSNLSAARLKRWTDNARVNVWAKLEHQTAKALAAWLDEDKGREVAFFDAMLAEDDPTNEPWIVTRNYMVTTDRRLSAAVLRHVLAKAEGTTAKTEKMRLLAIAVSIALDPHTDIAAYWETYNCIAREPGCEALHTQLTTVTVDEWRRQEQVRKLTERQRRENEKARKVLEMAPMLTEISSGGQHHYLEWAAYEYFEGDDDHGKRCASVRRVADLTDDATAEAIVAGWTHLATTGLGGIDAARLGKAEAASSSYRVEAAVIAGVDRLVDEDRLPPPAIMPIEVAIAVLKSSYVVRDQERRSQLEKWALDRLNLVPTTGATQLIDYWGAALDAGATQLSGLWRLLEEDARGGAVEHALDSLLETRRTMASEALRSALRAGAKHLSHARLLSLAEAALGDTAVTGAQRAIWAYVAFALDSAQQAEQFMAEYGSGDVAALFDRDMSDGLVEAFGNVGVADKLHQAAVAVRLLGRGAAAVNEGPLGGSASNTVYRAINALAGDSCAEARDLLSSLVDDPNLAAWRPNLRHAQAQQTRLRRDQSFKHPTTLEVQAAIGGGPPINASDLRAVVMEELRRLRDELHTTDTMPWKRFWNVNSTGRVEQPRIENECRDHVLDRLRDRLKKYGIAAAVPEARRGEETRADILVLTGAGRNLPIEAKRHFHPEIWIAASTQLQEYTADPGADGFGIYLVFWFGNNAHPTVAKHDGSVGPSSAVELETMLIADLSQELQARTDVIVFDVSDPEAAGLKKPRRKRASRQQLKSSLQPPGKRS